MITKEDLEASRTYHYEPIASSIWQSVQYQPWNPKLPNFNLSDFKVDVRQANGHINWLSQAICRTLQSNIHKLEETTKSGFATNFTKPQNDPKELPKQDLSLAATYAGLLSVDVCHGCYGSF